MKRVFSVPSRSISSKGPLLFAWQSSHGSYLAVYSSADPMVKVFDRHGTSIVEIPLAGACAGLAWDRDGDTLAVINNKSPTILLWDSTTQKTSHVESGLKDGLSFLCWSKIGSNLAIGTVKGNLLLYNHQTSRKIPILGKHTKRIVSGAWSNSGLLALGSEDRTMSISTSEGDTVRQASVRDTPHDLYFSEMKMDERSPDGENTISALIGRKTLLLYNLNDPDNPMELAFQNKYGLIVQYKWFGDGYILFGFSAGYFVQISTHLKEIGQEIYQSRNHKEHLSSIDISHSLDKAASAGDNCIKIHSLSDMKEVYSIVTLEDERHVDKISWTEDGQLMAVSTAKGGLHIYLSQLPLLGHSCGTRVAYLTSLLEVTIQDQTSGSDPDMVLPIEVEPTFIALGPSHLAIGMNNRAWFYILAPTGPIKHKEREYLGTVQGVHLNEDYVAVRFEGKVQLHTIDTDMIGVIEEQEAKLFPDRNPDSYITDHAVTSDFFIYATDKGELYYFFIADWNYVNEFRHLFGIRKIFPDPSGSRLIFVDDKNDGFVYNPVNDNTMEIEGFPPTAKGILWETTSESKKVFLTYDNDQVYTFLFSKDGNQGSEAKLVRQMPLPFGHVPLMLMGNDLTLQAPAGSLQTLNITSSLSESPLSDMKPSELRSTLDQCTSMHKFKEAWLVCENLKSEDAWRDLGKTALKALNLPFATRVYQRIGDVGMVTSLLHVKGTEDQGLLAGYVTMFLGDFDAAQDLFLSSATPKAALEMRRDLLHWDAALKLAQSLAPDEIPLISKEYGMQLEFTGDYTNALLHYEKGVTRVASRREHDESCAAGVARMAIRTGDIRRGMGMALKIPSRVLKKECGGILEGMKQWSEAGLLYEKGEYWDKAASVYIRSKNWPKVGELLPHVNNPKIHMQYGKVREVEGGYKQAAIAYANGKDWENVIRINLDYLHNPEEAVKIVRDTHSLEGAKMVAKFFLKLNDYSSAIQFLVMSKCNDEAFRLAQAHGQMEVYAEIIGDDATPEDYQSVALYFENEKNHLLAGKFYLHSQQYSRALKHFLRVHHEEDSESIELAIDTVGRAEDETLTHQLVDYLMGEVDNMPKDPKYLFRLYMALKRYREAARTAVIIAREEQNTGNYRSAHDVLYSMYQQLTKQKIKIPTEMSQNLMVLHSYIMVRTHVKLGDHLNAARLLIRVANHISKFPSHIVPILTSTVIECSRSGLKKSAFSYAAMLMRPEYRNDIDLKYKKKIEGIVRKPDKTEEEGLSLPCPFCDSEVDQMELMCPDCKNSIPYCIVTGYHITKDNLGICKYCEFPAHLKEFSKYLDREESCPMCSERLSAEDVSQVQDFSKYISSHITSE